MDQFTGYAADVTDEARDEAYQACHPTCSTCGVKCCDAQLTCCCGPAPLRAGVFDVFCGQACREEWEAGEVTAVVKVRVSR